jgi:predicted RNase H-like HicB family nuclease
MPLTYALIHGEDGSFGVSFPDFPGAITSGRSAEEAIRKASEMLSFHVAGMVEDGDVLPQLRGLADLQADPDFVEDSAGAVLALIPFDMPTRAVRVNITIEESLLKAIDQAASAGGQSRSAYLAEAARARIRTAA